VEPRRALLNRVLLGVVILLGVLIVAALIALIYGAYAGWSKQPEPAKPTAILQSLPPGARILDMKVDNGRTVVRLKTRTGEEILIYDTASGKLIARIAAPAE